MVTKNRDHFFLSAHLLAEAVSRTEAAAAAAGGCPQSVESAVLRAFENAFDVAGAILRAFENASRTPRSPFCHRMSQKTHRVPQEPVLRTEYPFRTGKACFLHRMPLKMRRVPEEAFLSTECVFRTVEACFWYGALPKKHRTWLSGAQKSGWQLPLRGLPTLG